MSKTGLEVNWKERSRNTFEIVKTVKPMVDQWKKDNQDRYHVVSYFEDFPPRFKLFVTFFGVNFITYTCLDQLTDIVTAISNTGLSKCSKYITGNDACYTFQLPFEG